jgi:hypothetical protein
LKKGRRKKAMSRQEKDDLCRVLKNCATVKDIFSVLERKYDLAAIELGAGMKPLAINGLVKLIEQYNPPKK